MVFNNKKFFPLFIILLIGLSLRFYGINYSLPTEERINYYFPEGLQDVSPNKLYVFGMLGTAHPDDVDMLGVISKMKPSKLDFNPHWFSYGGCLHFFTLALFLKIASLLKLFVLTPIKNYYFFNPAEFAKMFLVGKTMVIAFAIATIFMVYLMSRSLYGEKTAILSMLFISILPNHVFLSHFMLPDIPVTFWTTLTIYFCINLLRTNRLKWYVLTGAACGLAGATKLSGLLLVFPIITAHLLGKPQGQKNYLFWLFDKRLILSFTTMILFYLAIGNPYIVVSFKETVDHILHRSPYHGVGTGFLPPTPLVFLKNIGKNLFIRSLIFLAVGLHGLLFFMLAGIAYAFYKRDKSDILLLGWIVPFYIIVSGLKWCSPAYLLPIIPLSIILISRFITNQQRLLRWVLVSIIVFYNGLISINYLNLMAQKDTRMEAAEWIRQNIPAGSTIGLTNDAGDDQYCTAPPLSKSRYKIKVINYESCTADSLEADYIILTGPLQMQLLPEVAKKFHEVKDFKKLPNILGFSFSRRQFSDPFIYNLMQTQRRIFRTCDFLQPDIKIFKRSN